MPFQPALAVCHITRPIISLAACTKDHALRCVPMGEAAFGGGGCVHVGRGRAALSLALPCSNCWLPFTLPHDQVGSTLQCCSCTRVQPYTATQFSIRGSCNCNCNCRLSVPPLVPPLVGTPACSPAGSVPTFT